MSKRKKNLSKSALDYFHSFSVSNPDMVFFHDYKFVNQAVLASREIAKAEKLDEKEYELGLAALILHELELAKADNKLTEIKTSINEVLGVEDLPEKDSREIEYYLDFFCCKKTPQTRVEKVLTDGKESYLSMFDALERLDLLRWQYEKVNNKNYSDLEWAEFCKQSFVMHPFYTRYANEKFGPERSKNYDLLEKRLERLKSEINKKGAGNGKEEEVISGKEGEDLFKLAFRNYLNLVTLADRKAGLLIQVNSIIASVIIGFIIKKPQDYINFKQGENTILFAIPVAIILVSAAVTIFLGILASKPLEKKFFSQADGKEPFFFGSFDRLDPKFHKVNWEKYSSDIDELFRGDKRNVFDELLKESFQVRKVLPKKFGYLSLAYKIFFSGFLASVLTLIFAIIWGM